MHDANEAASLPPSTESADLAMTQAINDVEAQFGVMVIKARNSIRTRAAAIHPDVQPMGYKVLTILARSGPLQQVHLAEEVRTDKAMMSRTVKQLECLGFVTRTTDPSDGRAMLVGITIEGRSRFDATHDAARQLLHDRFSVWDVTEVQRLADLLARLNESNS